MSCALIAHKISNTKYQILDGGKVYLTCLVAPPLPAAASPKMLVLLIF